ncbi:MAG: helix-turn-helix transcriptional regulator [Mycobacterium sp.]
MPTRPSQNSPERVANWERWRAVVGGNIRACRTGKGMTQEALALRSGVTRNVLMDVEHGKRGILYERLIDIANALGVPVGDLFTEADDAKS